MEYVDGQTLDKFLANNPTKKDTLIVLAELLKAVAYVHDKQIIHRDIKPTNIMVLSDGHHIKLIDFGLADSEAYEILKQPCGTEGYVSAEQRNDVNDVRNDIYSIGCIMKEMRLGWQMSCKRAQSRTCSGYAERSRHYANVVQASAEPNLFGLCRAQPTLCNTKA